MKRTILLLCFAGILPGSRGLAQEDPLPRLLSGASIQPMEPMKSKVPAKTLEAAPLPLDGEAFTVPIHRGEADPVGGIYGVWASGPDFKVSFHDGFAFYPLLGPAYQENLPLRWKTESVTVGTRPLFPKGSVPETNFEDWRFEYTYPGVTEAYDVGKSGVEQTFTLHSPPSFQGDLVVTGRITTRLKADPSLENHRPMVFEDQKGAPLSDRGGSRNSWRSFFMSGLALLVFYGRHFAFYEALTPHRTCRYFTFPR